MDGDVVHVVHVITRGDVGGAQTHVVELAGAQVEAGFDVTVIAGTDGPAVDRCRACGIHVVVVPSLGQARAQLWQRRALADLQVAIDAATPDIVHAHSSNAGFLARIVCRRSGHPCVYTAHGWPFQRGAPWPQRLLSFVGEFVAGRLGDGVICLTEAEAARARRSRVVRRGRLWVIPNGLADVPPDLRRRERDQPPAVIMVARFAPPKLQRELVDAMAGLLDRAWTMTFVGDGPELAACREHGHAVLGDRVRFVGHRDDVTMLLAEHDVMVLWSRYEGMPISLLEGMRAGLCCVGSDLPGVRVLFGDPPCGVIASDASTLGVELSAVLDAPATIRSHGDHARSRFVRCFSSSAMQASTSRVYAELLARR